MWVKFPVVPPFGARGIKVGLLLLGLYSQLRCEDYELYCEMECEVLNFLKCEDCERTFEMIN